MRTLIRIQLKT